MIHPKVTPGFSIATPDPDYRLLWVPACVAFRQIVPGVDSYFCVNERGQSAAIGLPDFAVSSALARILYELPRPHVVLVQQILQDKDRSYLVPVTLGPEQNSILMQLIDYLTRNQVSQWVKGHDWHKFVSDIRLNNSASLNDPSCWHQIARVSITDRSSPSEPDDMTGLSEFVSGAPVFFYTDPTADRVQSRADLLREIFVRQFLAQSNIDSVRSAIKDSTLLANSDESSEFVDVINKGVVEIKLHMSSGPSWADLFLNPEATEFSVGPPPELRFTPKGEKTSAQWPSRELRVGVANWGESNIAQVTLHVPRFKDQSAKDSVTTPSVAVFKDDLGLHMLRSELFRLTRNVPPLPSSPTGRAESVVLDTIPAPQIPEIGWEPISGEVAPEWWHTDVVAKKVLWLAAVTLASHLVGDPLEVVYSVTPIGSDVVQVATLFDGLEAGAPYAFAVIRGNTAVRAIPVFQTGTFQVKPEGSLAATKRASLKNWGITRQGERIESGQEILLFNNPTYAAILTGKYTEPKIHAAHQAAPAVGDIAKAGLALCTWRMGIQPEGRNDYVMLRFTSDRQITFIGVVMEPEITDARAAVRKLFGLTNPIEVPIEGYRSSWGDLLCDLKQLTNPQHMPWKAIVPSSADNRIFLCLEAATESLQVGLMLDPEKPAIARIRKSNEEVVSITNLVSDFCSRFLSGIPIPTSHTDSLADLLAVVKNEHVGLVMREGLEDLRVTHHTSHSDRDCTGA